MRDPRQNTDSFIHSSALFKRPIKCKRERSYQSLCKWGASYVRNVLAGTNRINTTGDKYNTNLGSISSYLWRVINYAGSWDGDGQIAGQCLSGIYEWPSLSPVISGLRDLRPGWWSISFTASPVYFIVICLLEMCLGCEVFLRFNQLWTSGSFICVISLIIRFKSHCAFKSRVHRAILDAVVYLNW